MITFIYDPARHGDLEIILSKATAIVDLLCAMYVQCTHIDLARFVVNPNTNI
jgi:hypothetical protein